MNPLISVCNLAGIPVRTVLCSPRNLTNDLYNPRITVVTARVPERVCKVFGSATINTSPNTLERNTDLGPYIPKVRL